MSVNSLRQVSSQDGTWVIWFRSNCHEGLLFRYRRLLCRPFIGLTRRQAAPGGGWTKWSWRSSPTLTILYLSLLTSRTKKGRLFTLSNTGFGTRHPHMHFTLWAHPVSQLWLYKLFTSSPRQYLQRARWHRTSGSRRSTQGKAHLSELNICSVTSSSHPPCTSTRWLEGALPASSNCRKALMSTEPAPNNTESSSVTKLEQLSDGIKDQHVSQCSHCMNPGIRQWPPELHFESNTASLHFLYLS